MSSAPTDPSLQVSSIGPSSSPLIEKTPSETVEQTAQLAAERLGLESSAHPQEIAPSQEKVEAFLRQESAASGETVPNPPVQAMVDTVSATKGVQELKLQAEELLEASQATSTGFASAPLLQQKEEAFQKKLHDILQQCHVFDSKKVLFGASLEGPQEQLSSIQKSFDSIKKEREEYWITLFTQLHLSPPIFDNQPIRHIQRLTTTAADYNRIDMASAPSEEAQGVAELYNSEMEKQFFLMALMLNKAAPDDFNLPSLSREAWIEKKCLDPEFQCTCIEQSNDFSPKEKLFVEEYNAMIVKQQEAFIEDAKSLRLLSQDATYLEFSDNLLHFLDTLFQNHDGKPCHIPTQATERQKAFCLMYNSYVEAFNDVVALAQLKRNTSSTTLSTEIEPITTQKALLDFLLKIDFKISSIPEGIPQFAQLLFKESNTYTQEFSDLKQNLKDAGYIPQDTALDTLLSKEQLFYAIAQNTNFSPIPAQPSFTSFQKQLITQYNASQTLKGCVELCKICAYIPLETNTDTIKSKEQLFDLLEKTIGKTLPTSNFPDYPKKLIEEYNTRIEKFSTWLKIASQRGLIPDGTVLHGTALIQLFDTLARQKSDYSLLTPPPNSSAEECEFILRYNQKIKEALLRDLLSLGLKPPKNPSGLPFEASQISDTDVFLQEIAIRNCYGEIPDDPSRSDKLKKAAALYEQQAKALREKYLNMNITLHKIQKITKKGIIQVLFCATDTLLGSGSCKTAYALHIYKPIAKSSGVEMVLKHKAIAYVTEKIQNPARRLDALASMEKEAILSHDLIKAGIPYILRGRIVRFMDTLGGSEERIYMERCWGDMITATNQNAFNDEGQAIFSLEIARSIRGLHREGFVHRDLKLDNVFLKLGQDETGQTISAEARLADFGMTAHTGTIAYISGTWMAPEQARAILDGNTTEQITCPTDLWTLGISLWGMRHSSLALVLSRPIHIRSVWTASGTASAADIPGKFQEVSKEARDVAEQTKEDIDVLIADLLSYDPAARPSADQVVARLEQYMQSKGYRIPPMPT